MAKYAGLIGGALVIAAGVISNQYWMIKGGFLLLATGAISAITSPDAPSLDNARRAELQMATSASGVPVPVFFGEQRLTGNFMQYDKQQLRTSEVRQSSPGGKGGGGGDSSQVVGYEYFLSYEYGICMGEVDGVAQVISTPGETKLLDDHPIVATTAAVAITTATFTRPTLVGSTVAVELNTELLVVGEQVQIGGSESFTGRGIFTVTAIADAANATLRLDEIIGTQLGGYGGFNGNVANSGMPVTVVCPSTVGVSRNLAFDDTIELASNTTISIDGFGDWKVVSIIDGTSAVCELSRLTGSGSIVIGTSVRTYVDAAQLFGASDTLELTLAGSAEGGSVRIYRGTEWQKRVGGGDVYASNGMNYRPMCWALFMDYKMGSHPQAQSHHFILRRLPKCLRDDGTVFSLLKTHGSNSTTNANYWQANPAAIIYEILTNKTWGRGMSSNLFDEASWQSVSEFFSAQNIGLGFTLDRADKLSNALAGIRESARILLLWDGAKLKIRTLLDTSKLHENIVTLNKSQVDNVKFTRPSWLNTSNEVRAEFANFARNYKVDAVLVQDVANVNTVGVINQRRVSLTGVTETTLAQRLANLILKESSYPLGALTFDMNRSASHLEPGDIVRFIWDEWSDGAVTFYGQVATIKSGGSEKEMLSVTLTEDVDLSAVESEETSVTPPTTLNWNSVTGVQNSDLNLTPPQQGNTLPILPLAVMEVPALVTGGKENRLAFIGQKSIPGLTGIAAYASQFGGNFRYLATTANFAATGTLLTTYAAGLHIDRTVGFEFSLNSPAADEGVVLQAASVITGSDHLSVLANSVTDFVVIGEEIIQVGYIHKLGPNRYKATNLLRGMFGTKIASVPVGAAFFYSHTMPDGIKSSTLDQEQETRFRGYPVDAKGVANIGGDIFIAHKSPNNRIYLGVGVRPLAPEPYSVEVSGLDATLKARPQFYDRGAATMSFERACNTPITNIGSMRFMVEALDGSGAVLQGKTLVTHTFTPDELDDVAAGMVEVAYTMPGGTAVVNLYSEIAGNVSVDPAAFSI